MKKLALLLSALLASTSAFSGNVADLFAQGVFGVPWGGNIETVNDEFPDGKQETLVGFETYIIKDGRELFDTQRDPDNYIRYHFDADGGMNGVTIQFPLNSAGDFGALFNKLNTYFGKSESMPNILGALHVQWPKDEGITIGLSNAPGIMSMGELIFAIEYHHEPASITREGLGF